MMIGLGIVTFACLYMQIGNSFYAAKVLFASIGVAFALIKVSVYSMIGLVTDTEQEYNSLMNSIEGVFMRGITLAYFLFSAFNSKTDVDAWLNVYLLLASLAILSNMFLFFTSIND